MFTATSKEIKGFRGTLLVSTMKRDQDRLVMDLEDEVATLEEKLGSLTDMYPNSEMTLRITKKDFNSKDWVKDTQELKVELKLKRVELKIARETTEEWFTDDEEIVTKSDDGGVKAE